MGEEDNLMWPVDDRPEEEQLFVESSFDKVIKDIIEERKRQDEKCGIQKHEPLKWLAILGEEVGESNKAILEESLEDYFITKKWFRWQQRRLQLLNV